MMSRSRAALALSWSGELGGNVTKAPKARSDGCPRNSTAAQLRRLALVAGMIFPLLIWNSTQAYALAGAPPPLAFVPAELGAAVAEGVGTAATISSVEGGVAVGTFAVAGVAAAPGLLVAGAVLAGAGAIYLGWKWLNGHDPHYADAVAASGTGFLGESVHFTCVGGAACTFTVQATSPRTFTMTGSAPDSQQYVYGYGAGNRNLPDSWSALGPWGSNSINCGGCNYGGFLVAKLGADGAYRAVGNILAEVYNTSGTTSSAVYPLVTTTPRSTCSNGSTTTTVNGPSISYYGTTAPADLPPILVPACPAGTQRIGFDTPSTGADGATVPKPLTWTAPTVPQTYANCAPGGSAAPCVMTLTMTDPAGEKTNCTSTGRCTSYPAAPADGSTYTCMWGPYTMPFADCADVSTKKQTGVSTATASDPCTQPVTSQGTGCAPASGTSVDTGQDGSSCSLSWSWNPVDWVLEPVKCALRWAFVPPPEVVPVDPLDPSQGTHEVPALNYAETQMQTAWGTSTPGVVGSALTGVFTGFTDLQTSGSCGGPALNIPTPGQASTTIHPLSTCPELISTLEGYIQPILQAITYAGFLMGGVRFIIRSAGVEPL